MLFLHREWLGRKPQVWDIVSPLCCLLRIHSILQLFFLPNSLPLTKCCAAELHPLPCFILTSRSHCVAKAGLTQSFELQGLLTLPPPCCQFCFLVGPIHTLLCLFPQSLGLCSLFLFSLCSSFHCPVFMLADCFVSLNLHSVLFTSHFILHGSGVSLQFLFSVSLLMFPLCLFIVS